MQVVGSLLTVHDRDGDNALSFDEFQDLVMAIEQEKR